jgi:hypothetical protein
MVAYASVPPYIMAWWLIKHGDNFILCPSKYRAGSEDVSKDIVACYATEDAVQIDNWVYKPLTGRNYTYLLHCYTFTITTRQSFQSVSHSLHHT